METTLQLKKNIGFKSLKRVILNTKKQMQDGEIQLVAASLSFSTAIALVPFIAVVLATFQSIAGLEVLYPKVESFLLRNLREAAGGDVTKFIRIFLQNINAGKMGSTGAVLLFITSIRLLHDMEVAIHRVWTRKNTRPFYKRLIYQWTIIVVIPLFLAVYVGFINLEKFKFVHHLLPIWVSNSLVLVGCLYMSYKYVPTGVVKSKAALLSALLAALSMFAVHKLFATLTIKFFHYSKIYGSFAALPVLLIWILSMWYIILGGAALCASLQKQDIT